MDDLKRIDEFCQAVEEIEPAMKVWREKLDESRTNKHGCCIYHPDQLLKLVDPKKERKKSAYKVKTRRGSMKPRRSYCPLCVAECPLRSLRKEDLTAADFDAAARLPLRDFLGAGFTVAQVKSIGHSDPAVLKEAG